MDKKAAAIGVAGAGLVAAAMAAWSAITPSRDAPVEVANVQPMSKPTSSPDPVADPSPVAARPRETMIRMRPVLPEARAEAAETVAPEAVAKPVAPGRDARVAEIVPAPRAKPKVAEPLPVRVAAKVVPAPPKARPPATRQATDIASLDQFVMNFYGQSWRYGDAPKRAVLEKTRASFVARRGACTGDTCRRNAYLDLMRDVSSIVETGKPEPR